eukprot:Clim_evm30s142 gene=Clim_evmTU30s142
MVVRAQNGQRIDISELVEKHHLAPLHTPRSIQPHGTLVVVHPTTFTVQIVSENVTEHLGGKLEDYRGKCMLNLMGHSLGDALQEFQKSGRYKVYKNLPVKLPFKDNELQPVDIDLYRAGNGLIGIEFQACDHDMEDLLIENFSNVLSDIFNSTQASQCYDSLVMGIKRISGYDRVMIYKFDSSGNGCVVAEAAEMPLNRYLGLHFPASDIPRQARALYVQNLVRVLGNVNGGDSRLYRVSEDCIALEPMDMTHGALRSVSPMHIEYLKNMGVSATMSCSLVQGTKLWGLVLCYHYSPRPLSKKAISHFEVIAQACSLQLLKIDYQAIHQHLNCQHEKLNRTLNGQRAQVNSIDQLLQFTADLMDVFEATGTLVSIDGKVHVRGRVPPTEFCEDLLRWIMNTDENTRFGQHLGGLYSTDHLSAHFPEAVKYTEHASGVLAVILPGDRNYLLFFRGEVMRTISWAGNPETRIQIDEDGSWSLHPRKSFAPWHENVHNTSTPWSDIQLREAEFLRLRLTDFLLNEKAQHLLGDNVEAEAGISAAIDTLAIMSHAP